MTYIIIKFSEGSIRFPLELRLALFRIKHLVEINSCQRANNLDRTKAFCVHENIENIIIIANTVFLLLCEFLLRANG